MRGVWRQTFSLISISYLPLVSREWKNGSNSRYNYTPFLHSLLTKGKLIAKLKAALEIEYSVLGFAGFMSTSFRLQVPNPKRRTVGI